MTDIRDASAHTDGFEPRPGLLPFGISPDDTPYRGDSDLYDEPYDELGLDDDVPRIPLALDAPHRTSLARAVQAGLRDGGCDTTLRSAHAWAQRERVPWPVLRGALEERGGFCDCEVLMNVLEAPD